jgi:hypothetical protein
MHRDTSTVLNTVVYSDGRVVRAADDTEKPPWVVHHRDFLSSKLTRDELAALLDDLKLGELRKLEREYVCPNSLGPHTIIDRYGKPRVFDDVFITDGGDPRWRLLLPDGTAWYRAISLRGISGCEPELFRHAVARLKNLDARPWSPETFEVVLQPDTLNNCHKAAQWPRTWPTPELTNKYSEEKVARLPAAEAEQVRSLLEPTGESCVTLPDGGHRIATWRWPALPNEQSWQQ